MRSHRVAALCLAAFAVSAAGCQPVSLYRWGSYEEVLYRSMAKPDGSDIPTQSDKLAAEVTRTLAQGQRVPPGVHAHLGYLYYMQGRVAEARVEFESERTAFPESTVFIDGLIAKMERGPATPATLATQSVPPLPVATAQAESAPPAIAQEQP